LNIDALIVLLLFATLGLGQAKMSVPVPADSQ
jgi:hypothetical protein